MMSGTPARAPEALRRWQPRSGSRFSPSGHGRPTLHIYAAVAEQEAKNVSERTTAVLARGQGKAGSGGQGRDQGRPDHHQTRRTQQAIAAKRSAAANREAADKFAANVAPVIQQVKASGATSLHAVAAALTARGIPTARGREWSPAQVGVQYEAHLLAAIPTQSASSSSCVPRPGR